MAPFNLENNIREKLENRELKPSSDAWEKLEAQLDKRQPKRKIVLWYYAAASFVGLLIISSIFFTQNNLEENSSIVENEVKVNTTDPQSKIIPEIGRENIASENDGEETKTKKKNSDHQVKSIPPKKQSTVDRKIKRMEAIAEVSENKTEKSSDELIIKQEDYFIDEKANELASNIKLLQNNNAEVTADDIERLLENALRDIQTKRILQAPKVDAMVLLEEVEWELDKSFRDKVFDVLGEGFQKIRTAISQRNN